MESDLKVRRLTPALWKDFEALFGPDGACAGCWCLWCRLPASEYRQARGAKAKAEMRRKVRSGEVPGLLAYAGGKAVGWCAVGPREEFRRLENSRLFKKYFTQAGAWSVPCLFVDKAWRGRGVTVTLLKAARKHARGKVLEGYPVSSAKRQADTFLWWGTESAFVKAGFKVVARPSASRCLVRA